MIKTGTVFAGRYKILQHIGSGGMADVYKAEDMSLGRQVALKIMKDDFSEDPTFIRRFKAEGKAAASLHNDNLVAVYDVGTAGKDYYIVMELIDGITLKEYIQRKGMLSARETMAITAQVAVGLRAAHQKHIIHRDIKPQNIILSRDEKVKITDFGIARANTDETRTMNTQAIGSVHYISPEQAKGGDCDERSDIYSLGISMYEMVTGKVPFDKSTSIAVALAHMNETMVPPSEINPDCPKSLEQIIFRCTQKSRERRYHNCTELLGDLKIAVANPDYDFELMEKETLMKSDTMTLTKESMEILRSEAKKSAVIVDDSSEEVQAEAVPSSPVYQRRRKRSLEEDAENTEEDDTEELTPARKKVRNLFVEDQEEDEKSILDRVLMILGIVLGAAMILMMIYIISSLSGCQQRDRSKNSSTASQSSQNADSQSTDEDELTVETFESEAYDSQTQTVVPNLIGLMVNSAIKILEDSDLKYQLSQNVIYSDVYKVGAIVKQSYPEGTIVLKDSVILITLCGGSDKFEIKEEYIGQNISEFRNVISQYKDIFEVEFIKENSDTVGVNRIISLEPSSGIIGLGDKLVVTYSGGPTMVEMPNLIGKTQGEAVALLNQQGLELGDVNKDYNSDVPEGLIMEQQYAPNQRIANGSRVNILVSLGPKSLSVPNVVDMTEEEAVQLLTEMKFEVEVGYEKTEDPEKVGKVLSQSLKEETVVMEGEYIKLTVGVDKIMKTVPDAVKDSDGDHMLPEAAVLVLNNAGFRNIDTTSETVITDDPDMIGLVAEQSPAAGTSYNTDDKIILRLFAEEETTTEESTEPSSSETEPAPSPSPSETEPSASETQPPESPAEGNSKAEDEKH